MGYDVVVIGAGSAGSVMAARLSEEAGRRVLLVEAGPDHTSAATPDAVAGPDFWRACAEPERIYADLLATHAPGQEPAIYLRGRGAGGSSSVNAMVGLRGVPADYDRWAGDLGCDGWSWEDLRPWLLGVEDDLEHGDDDHGKGGPIPLHRLPVEEWSGLDRAMLTATADLGYPSCPDYHEPGVEGFGPAALTIRNHRRVSTNDAYLEPARDRPNLTVRGDVLVDRIAFDGEGRATGVVTADGEVIDTPAVVLSAGTIHSPAILLRSGVDDRPVGANLIEHPLLPFVLLPSAPPDPGEVARTVSTVLRYSSGLSDAGPVDMQILPLTTFGAEPPLSAASGLGVTATRVFSRGTVTLAGRSPTTQPAIHFQMLSDPRDRDRMADGIRRLAALVTHPAIAGSYQGVLAGEIPLPDLDLGDRGARDAWMDATVGNYVHSVGTCRMGRPTDPAAVVDTSCRLIGRHGVHVVDASVMPDIPRANVHLSTVAIAERVAADMRR